MTIHESLYPRLYPLFVLVGLASLLLGPGATRQMTDRETRRRYYIVQAFTFAGAIVGAKIAVLMGDRNWPWVPLGDWHEIITSGRSITGGLLGGLLAAEIAKPLMRYTLPPNDAFAARLPFSIAIGRLGCLLGGCCRGLPHDGVFSVRYEDGIARYPTQLIEVLFELAVGLVFVHCVRRRLLHGRLFALYLVLYGAFRFVTEFFRDTPRWLGHYSTYQAISLFTVVVGAVTFAWRTAQTTTPHASQPSPSTVRST